MGTLITGPDPNQTVWPVIQRAVSGVTRPAGDALVGGTYPAVLGDNSDTTYVQEKTASNYYRLNVAALALPNKARITMVSAAARARLHSGNTLYKDFLVGIGDHSKAGGAATDISGGTIHGSLGTTFRTYTSASKYLTSQNQQFSQTDINKGVYVALGLNVVYGAKTSANGADIADAWIRYTYDLPPTATITNPAPSQTISNTAAPIITWDYSDDFQVQAKYQVTIFSGASKIYDSGLVTSSDTFHDVNANLANGTYTVHVRVYQKWTLPVGGDFPAVSDATQTFTIAIASLGTPRLSASTSVEHAVLTVYPDINLLSYDSSTMDNGYVPWNYGSNATVASSASPVRDGNLSLKVTITSTTFPNVRTSYNELAVTPGQILKGFVYINPLALSGRTATFSIEWRDATGSFLTTSSGSATALPTNTWTQVGAANMTAPANAPTNAAYACARIDFGGSVAVNDVMYVDDAGLWWQYDTATLPTWSRGGFFETTLNLLSYSDSTFEDQSFTWTPDAASLVAQSTTKFIHGTACLNLTKAVTGTTGTITATLGNANNTIPVIPGQVYTCYGWVNCDAPLTASNGFLWYQSNGTASATASSQGGAVAVTAGAWWLISGNVTVPADAAYGVPYIRVAGASSGNQYWDALSYYMSTGFFFSRFWRGFYPNTDDAPTMLIEYSDDLVNWKTLQTQLAYQNNGQYSASDYTIPNNVSGQSRTYRVSVSETENGQLLTSPYSATVNVFVTFSNVWMHADGDPVDTIYNYRWDGGGRTDTIDAKGINVEIEGLEYQFTQFGIESVTSLDVTLHLDSFNDMGALHNLASLKGLVVFRDQRGRVYRGVMGAVKFVDFQPSGQDASFTLQLSGNQP